MRVLELFAGSRSIGKIAEKRGHEVCSVDINGFDNIDIVKDIEFLEVDDLPFVPDVIWSGTPCTTYSIAAVGHHRDGLEPKTEFAVKCDRMNIHVNNLIKEIMLINPNIIYYIENPRGMLRKMPFMREHDRTLVTYCSYNDMRMKPTDIWSNNLRSLFNPDGWEGRPICSNYKYDDCGNILRKHCHHESAQRGARTGTQGLKDNYHRSKMPEELCLEIIIATERKLNGMESLSLK